MARSKISNFWDSPFSFKTVISSTDAGAAGVLGSLLTIVDGATIVCGCITAVGRL